MDSKFKFHSFDALRFFSFLIVFISHLPFNLFPKNILSNLELSGKIGVIFFFTLSGFLITYLLLSEKTNTKTINFKNFAFRRILRIWPLFYFMILFAFLSSYIISYLGLPITNTGYQPNWLILCLFLDNYLSIINHQFANISPLPVMWSLCVEEHFYIIWGLTLYFCKTKNLPIVICLFILLANIARYFFFQNNLMFFDILTNIDFFMFGAIPAYLFTLHKNKTINFINNISKLIKGIILIIIALSILFSSCFDLRSSSMQFLFGILFCFVLFIFLPQKNTFFIKDKNIFSILGKYTYGLYLIHMIAIVLVKHLFVKTNLPFTNHFILYTILTLFVTILGAYLSYHLIEKPFLKLKDKFQN